MVTQPPILYLWGPDDRCRCDGTDHTSKQHLAAALLNELNHERGQYPTHAWLSDTDFDEACRVLRESGEDSPEETQIGYALEVLLEREVIVLNDLGLAALDGIHGADVAYMLETRALKAARTIITSRLSPNDLPATVRRWIAEYGEIVNVPPQVASSS